MSDFMRNLPLSSKEQGDESGVHSNRNREYADVLEQAAIIADTLTGTSLSARDIDRLRPWRGPVTAGSALSARLRALALDARNGRKIPVRLLSRAVLVYLRLAREAGLTPALTPLVSGAVALHLATSAPLEIRAVIRYHALRATDAEWEFGRGPVLEAPAAELIEFLSRRSLTPPRPAQR